MGLRAVKQGGCSGFPALGGAQRTLWGAVEGGCGMRLLGMDLPQPHASLGVAPGACCPFPVRKELNVLPPLKGETEAQEGH